VTLDIKFQTKEEFDLLQTLKLEKSNKKQRRSFDIQNLSDEDLEMILQNVKRPSDHRNKRKFHFLTVEKDSKVFLFDGFSNLIKIFEKKENENEIEFNRKIRVFALEMFLSAENPLGGFLYN
jgi:hypothetical protein